MDNGHIDSHVHFWTLSLRGEAWSRNKHPVLLRDYLPGHLQCSLDKFGFRGAIAVQGTECAEENDFLFQLAESGASVIGVISWLDLMSEQFEEQYEAMKNSRYFLGIRPALHRLIVSGAIFRPDVLSRLEMLQRDQCPVELLVTPDDLPVIARLLDRLPRLHAVINHLGWFMTTQPSYQSWAQSISALAAYPRTVCKLSGMITINSGRDSDFLRPYVSHVIREFGVRRTMFGSDWPVALKAGTYDEVIDVFHQALPPGLGGSELDRILGGNAEECYRLPRIRTRLNPEG